MAALLLEQGQFQAALALSQSLAREVKKLDDKPLLVEVHLTESKVHYALKNFPKARASLTAARTAAISVYLGPEVQSRIDAQAGALSAEDRDYKTAYSYFFEGFEAASHMGEIDAARAALRRMLLAKIMNGDTDEAMAIINGKHGVEHAGDSIEAMRAVAQAYKERSLHSFLRAQREYAGPLQDDPLVWHHLQLLADTMLEANLLRVVEPYSRVELDHVARSIALPLPRVEAKLSQMILDGALRGTLDQGKGHLIVFREAQADPGYEAALKAVAALDGVVDGLFERAKGLS